MTSFLTCWAFLWKCAFEGTGARHARVSVTFHQYLESQVCRFTRLTSSDASVPSHEAQRVVDVAVP